jgi:hypothetical protein
VSKEATEWGGPSDETGKKRRSMWDMIKIDLLFIVLRPAQKYFTDMETSPLPAKDCKI